MFGQNETDAYYKRFAKERIDAKSKITFNISSLEIKILVQLFCC